MNNPESVIRRYLEAHGGRAESHIRHLTDSWEVTEVGEDDLEAIRGALAGVGVVTDPPLPATTSNGRLTLYIGDEEAPAEEGGGMAVLEAEAEPEVEEPATEQPQEELGRRRRWFARRSEQRPEPPTKISNVPSSRANGWSADEPAPEAPAARSAEVPSMVEAFFEQERAGVDARLEELARNCSALQERLAEGSDALAQARADADSASDDVEGRLAQLEGRIKVLSVERQAEFESLFRGLVQSERQVAGAQEEREAEAARIEQQLAHAHARVSGARGAVNEAQSSPDLRAELDVRLAALSEAEGLERELRERQATAAQQWADQVPELQARVSRAREALGSALLAAEEGEQGEVRADPALAEAAEALSEARVRAAGAEQRMAAVLEALDRESAHAESVREELEQLVADIQQGGADAILGSERRAALQGQLDTFMDAQRQELERVQLSAEEWLSGVRERLEQTRAELEQERTARVDLEQRGAELEQARTELRSMLETERTRRGELETALVQTRAHLEQTQSELEQAQAALAEARAGHADQSERHAELERELGQLEAARQGHEAAVKHRRAELAALNQELESALADAERRAEEASGRSRVVTEIQRSAASALFVEADEAAKLEQQLHEAIAREQESRAALETHQTRAAKLRQELATVESQIAATEAAEAEATSKLEAHRQLHREAGRQAG